MKQKSGTCFICKRRIVYHRMNELFIALAKTSNHSRITGRKVRRIHVCKDVAACEIAAYKNRDNADLSKRYLRIDNLPL